MDFDFDRALTRSPRYLDNADVRPWSSLVSKVHGDVSCCVTSRNNRTMMSAATNDAA